MAATQKQSKLEAPQQFTPYTPKEGEEYMNEAQRDHFRRILMNWKRELMDHRNAPLLFC